MRHDLSTLEAKEILPGFLGRFVHSETMTLATWQVAAGSNLPTHQHHHEQVVYVLEGQLELTLDDEVHLLEPGAVLVIASNLPHSARAVTDCKVLDVFQPVRDDYR